MGAARAVEPVDMGAVFVEAFACEASKGVLGVTLAGIWRKQATNLNSVIATCNAMTVNRPKSADVAFGMAVVEVERHSTVLAIVVRAIEAWFDRFAPGVEMPGGVTWSSDEDHEEVEADEDHDEVTELLCTIDVDAVSRDLFAAMAPDARW